MMEYYEGLFENDSQIAVAKDLQFVFDDVLIEHGFVPLNLPDKDIVKRSEPSFVQTVFQVRFDRNMSITANHYLSASQNT